MKTETAKNNALTAQEFAFVAELLNGSTVEQASEVTGIKIRTAFNWKKKPHIQAAIAAGKEGHFKIVEQFQAERIKVVLPEISQALQVEAPKALQVILEIMRSGAKSDMVRLQAAKEIIRLAGIIESQRVTQNTEYVSCGLSPEGAEQIRRQILGITD
ncbi:MAG: hypothetical protein H0X31_00120 [Nostocaceae cyanobacterium]|nr:hypothetical protein [Nostocaceae cyanobacterium]